MRRLLLLAAIPIILAACAGAQKPTAAEDAPAEVSMPLRKAPPPRGQATIALREPETPSAALSVSTSSSEGAIGGEAAADEAAAAEAARKAAAEKSAAEKAAADKAAADKAARDRAAAEKAAADKAARDKAAADKAARDKAAREAAAKAKPEPAPAATGLPEIKSVPPSQAIVVDPAAEGRPDISRRVSATEGSRFELPFEGTGWTYLGDRDGKDGILYGSRRFEGAQVVFSLNAAKAGDYVLRFQRQDALRGLAYEENVAVAVSPREAGQVAPSSAAKASVAAAASSQVDASPATTPSSQVAPTASTAAIAAAADSAAVADSALAKAAPMSDKPEDMLLFAREELAAGRPQGAIDALDRLLARYPAGMDEAFYLYGLALEQSGPLKDIKRAYTYYRIVRDDYPESAFWDRANARIGYIDRHYFEIR